MMRPEKMHWVLDVVIGQANAMLRVQSIGTPNNGELLTKEQWDTARGSVKTYAARILAALQKDNNLTYEDYLSYKGKQRG